MIVVDKRELKTELRGDFIELNSELCIAMETMYDAFKTVMDHESIISAFRKCVDLVEESKCKKYDKEPTQKNDEEIRNELHKLIDEIFGKVEE